MALFQFRWLRRFIRKHTNPIPVDRAGTVKQRLSFAYMLIGWNAFGLVCYMVYTGKADWAKYYGLKSEAELNMTTAQQWCKTLGIANANVYRYSGITKKQEYSIIDGEIIKENKVDVDKEIVNASKFEENSS